MPSFRVDVHLQDAEDLTDILDRYGARLAYRVDLTTTSFDVARDETEQVVSVLRERVRLRVETSRRWFGLFRRVTITGPKQVVQDGLADVEALREEQFWQRQI